MVRHWLFDDVADPAYEPKKKGLEHWLFSDVKIPPPKPKKAKPTEKPVLPKHEIFKDIPKITWKQLQLTREPIKLPVLRPYQKEALDKWLIMKKGIIVLPTGTGKTLVALEAIRRVDGTVAIIVPTIPILKTVWVNPMRRVGWNVGVFYGEETHDLRAITVFTYQSAIRYPQVLKNYSFIIFDECLPYDTKVLLEDGSQLPIGEIVEKKLPLKVLSYNILTGKIEPKRITHYFKIKNNKPLITLKHKKGVLTLTADHKVFTLNRGYVPAEELNSSDMMVYIENVQVQNLRKEVPQQASISRTHDTSLSSSSCSKRIKRNSKMEEKPSRVLQRDGEEIFEGTQRRRKSKLQRSPKKYSINTQTKTNNIRRFTRRSMCSQRRFSSRGKTADFTENTKLGKLVIFRAQRICHNSPQKNGESRFWKNSLCVFNMLSQDLHRNIQTMLSQQSEDCKQRMVEPDKSPHSLSNMVYDGRVLLQTFSQQHKHLDSQVHSKRTKTVDRLAGEELGCASVRGCYRKRQERKRILSQIESRCKGQTFRSYQTLYTSSLQIQNPSTNKKDSMCNLRQINNSNKTSINFLGKVWKKSILQPKMQERGSESILPKEKEDYVYDIEVEDNHNFFANGVLVSNCHHLSAPVYSELLDFARRADYAMGLTATISRRDPKNYEIFKVMPIVYEMSIVEARKGGWVAPIQVTSVPAFMTSEERSEYYDLQDKIRSAAIRLGTTDPTVWAKLAAEGDVIAQSGLKALAKRRALLSLVKDKMKHVLEIVRKHPEERILLFSESIPAIEKLRDYLRKHGVTCAVYHSEMPKDRRMNVLRYWGRTFNVLLSVTALEEGIDVPEVSVGIIHASGRTPRKIVQRLGRIIRPRPGKIARIYIVYVPGTVEENVKRAVIRAVREVR